MFASSLGFQELEKDAFARRREAPCRRRGRRCCCRASTCRAACPLRAASGSRRHESDFHGIVHVVSAPELRRPALRRLEEIRQRRHGPVVKIRRAQPHAVERNRDIAVRLPECRELPVVSVAEGVVRRRGVRRPRVEPMSIGADLRDRYHRAGAGAAECVAGGACALEDASPLLRRSAGRPRTGTAAAEPR